MSKKKRETPPKSPTPAAPPTPKAPPRPPKERAAGVLTRGVGMALTTARKFIEQLEPSELDAIAAMADRPDFGPDLQKALNKIADRQGAVVREAVDSG